ncbi:unnamed protein product [Orchesella dallaii]|uniref:Uncharacterized protein n=1 Tax=Orchesella dallaii TaxID=48710 RepID=A0ABP1QFC1_9HEXA
MQGMSLQNEHLGSIAASQKRQDSPNDSHIKLFKQSPNPVKISDEDWYATEDDSQNEPTPLKGNSPQAPNHSAFKTICEETDPKGKCLTSQTKTKAGLETHTKQSQDQLLQSIDHLISSQHHLTESEAILIRQMIANMSKTLQELQNAAQKPCTNSNGASGKERMTNHDEGQNIMQGNGKNVDKGYDDGRQITEIEERHITERKVTKKKEKDTKVDMKKEVDSLKGNDDEVKNSIDTQSEENRDRVDESNANTHKKVDSRKRTVGTNENLVPVGTTANYLDGRRADVNYNAGINRPIDDLKEQYPYGKWPEEGDEAEIDNELDSETVTEPGGEEEGSENKEDEYASDYEDDMKVINFKAQVGPKSEQQ